MKPDATDLIELARGLYQYVSRMEADSTIDSHRQKVIGAMAHLTPTGSLQLVPSVVDTVIEQETISLYSAK